MLYKKTFAIVQIAFTTRLRLRAAESVREHAMQFLACCPQGWVRCQGRAADRNHFLRLTEIGERSGAVRLAPMPSAWFSNPLEHDTPTFASFRSFRGKDRVFDCLTQSQIAVAAQRAFDAGGWPTLKCRTDACLPSRWRTCTGAAAPAATRSP
jgi:hypothetical protein